MILRSPLKKAINLIGHRVQILRQPRRILFQPPQKIYMKMREVGTRIKAILSKELKAIFCLEKMNQPFWRFRIV
jgi:hypothetical protein